MIKQVIIIITEKLIINVLSVADPGSGMGKKSGSGSGMNKPDHIFESLETIFWIKIFKFFDADPGSGMEKIRIRENHPRSARKKISLLRNPITFICFLIFSD